MLKLLADNRRSGFFRAEKNDAADTLYIYDMIVATDLDAEIWGGVSAESFVKTIKTTTAPVLHLRINSPGGDVFAARAMEQALREYSGKVIAHIDGYAASAASFLAMSADEIVIAKGGFFMIHKAWTIAVGNADDLLSVASLLEKLDGTLVQTYAYRTGKAPALIADWMAEETWFSAQESVDNGFADKIAEDAPKNKANWDMSAYAHAPESVAPEAAPVAATTEEKALPDIDALRRKLRIVEKAA